MSISSMLAGLDRPILFLKATVKRQVYIAQYVRSDGTVVPGHHTFVHVSADHDADRVLAGNGSHSQRQAHARLAREDWFLGLERDHKVNLLLEAATDIQNRASLSAAVSGWKAQAMDGQNPSRAQWLAFYRLPNDRKSALIAEVKAARGNTDHLLAPALDVPETTRARVEAENGAAPTPVVPNPAPVAATPPVAPVAPAPVAPVAPVAPATPRRPTASPEWLALATDDFQNRGSRYPASGQPDSISVHALSDRQTIEFSFKNTSPDVGTAWVRHYLSRRGISFNQISATQEGDYADDWVSVHVSAPLPAPVLTAAAPVVAPVPAAISVTVRGNRLTQNPDGSWMEGGTRHGDGSPKAIVANVLSGTPMSDDYLKNCSISARLSAADILLDDDRMAADVLKKLFPTGDNGVMEGDTKVLRGVTYVLRDGRWHLMRDDDVATASSRAASSQAASVGRPTIPELPSSLSTSDRVTAQSLRELAVSDNYAAFQRLSSRLVISRQSDQLKAYIRTLRSAMDARLHSPAAGASLPAPVAAPRVVSVRAAAPMQASINAMAAVQSPTFSDTSETNRGSTRRVNQLREMAARGDIDGITNFAVSRTRSNYARVADYRDALLAAAQAPTVDQANAAIRAPVPPMPDIRGANMENTALLAARRKVSLLHEAATLEGGDPVARILAISTSRGNNYLNAVDDYKAALLLHFGVDRTGAPIQGATAEVASASVRSPIVVAASERVSRPAAPSSPSATPAPAPIPPSQNPAIAANPLGLSERELGFVPRPNVPLTTHVGNALNNPNFRWPHPDMKELARRYMAQPTSLQSRAKDYQSGAWRPPVPETPQARAAREAAAATARKAEMAAIRAAAAKYERRRAAAGDFFNPTAPVGANLSAPVAIAPAIRQKVERVMGVSHETAARLFSEMICDYGGGVMFNVTVRDNDANSIAVTFIGSDRTQITRHFKRSSDGLTVYHAYFKAGATGEGSGKALFRTSMGVYLGLGVKNVGVTANIDVGGYAWARYGYLPRNWPQVVNELRFKLNNIAHSLTEKQKNTVLSVLNEPSPEALWKLSDMQLSGRKIGKELLLGMCWAGVMDLGNPRVMKRLRTYVA